MKITMKLIDAAQGSPEWHAARAKHFCASEAPAMMGASPYMTRNDLLRVKRTGVADDVDAATQKRFDDGHATEAAARPLVEALIGAELYPVTATDDDGYLLASFDGVTMDGTTGYEHKLWNESLAAQVRTGELPPAYYWQLEQQALVSGLERIIFACSDGTPEKFVSTEYRPVPGRAAALLAGWKQFEQDLANYKHVEVIPATTAAPVMALPALSIRVQGSIALTDNLKVFGEELTAFIARIPEKPSNDQEFADCKAACKALQEAQDALDAAEAHALGQISSFDEMKRTKAALFDLARSTRLAVEKLVAAREQQIKVEIRQAANDAFALHVANLNTRIGKPYLSLPIPDFAGAMKSKRTIASLHDACDTLLAMSKIAANEIADRIQINLNALRDLAKDHAFLFADAAQIVLKAPEDLSALVKVRISEHAAAEQKRLDAEREKIRQEEQIKAETEARAKVEAEQKAAAAQSQMPDTGKAGNERPSQHLTAQDTAPAAASTIVLQGSTGMTGISAMGKAPLDGTEPDYAAAIRAFLNTRKEPQKKINEMRATLVEFVKFLQNRSERRAA